MFSYLHVNRVWFWNDPSSLNRGSVLPFDLNGKVLVKNLLGDLSFHSRWNFWKSFRAKWKIFPEHICCEMTVYQLDGTTKLIPPSFFGNRWSFPTRKLNSQNLCVVILRPITSGELAFSDLLITFECRNKKSNIFEEKIAF